MSVKNIIFNNNNIIKNNFYVGKNLSNIHDIDVNKIIISKKESYGKKNHINTIFDVMPTITLAHYV